VVNVPTPALDAVARATATSSHPDALVAVLLLATCPYSTRYAGVGRRHLAAAVAHAPSGTGAAHLRAIAVLHASEHELRAHPRAPETDLWTTWRNALLRQLGQHAARARPI
jgi:hypothetical protein